MTQKSTDLRILRTRALLHTTLIDLIIEKGFDAVTVRDIAGRAMINRATFYRHFEDKYALVSDIFEETVERVLSQVGPPAQRLDELAWLSVRPASASSDPAGEEMQRALRILTGLFEHFAAQAKLYRALLGKNGSSWFATRMRTYIAGIWQRRLRDSGLLGQAKTDAWEIMPVEVATTSLASWFIGMLTWWLESDMSTPPRQLAAWSLYFMVHGYYHSLGF